MGRHEDSARARGAAVEVARRLQDAGHVAYFAGGCVRDELLGLEPTDYDVATDATPDAIRGLFDRTSEVGAAFGVMLVRERGQTIEVATFREEGTYSDRRRPDEVRFSTADQDAKRRDYTVNALFLDPVSADERDEGRTIHGHVIDLVGGMEDLHARRIRAVGDPGDRLAEDHLRALRAVRLAAKLGFEIEPETARAIREHASELVGVSRERIGEEVRRMMRHASRARAVELMHALGLDAPVLGAGVGDRALRVLGALPAGASASAAMGAWAIDRVGEEQAAGEVGAWRERLMLSNEESRSLRDALACLGALRSGWATMPVAARKRLLASPGCEDALALLGAIDPGAGEGIARDAAALASDGVGVAPAPVLTGDDLVGAGLRPGRGFKGLLDLVYDAQLEGRVGSREEALRLAERESGRFGVSR
ncbi:MAG: CCA tRNA nucleotidyltransferase [Phycisphaerales bacterium JB059]